MFTFGEGDLARGCVDMQLLIRSSQGWWWVGPVAQNENITEKRVREGRVWSVYTSDCRGVLFMHELVGALLPFLGKVAIGEMVAVKALMGPTVGAIKDGERGAR